MCALTLLFATSLVACGQAESGVLGPDTLGPAGPPTQTDLTDPISAVKAYTEWISYAYRIGDSTVAEHAMSEWEEVRVSAYVQYNRIEGRAIDQSLLDASYTVVEQGETTATVSGEEHWRYRYTDADGTVYSGPEHEARYDVTYTVIIEEPKGWVVDSVDVRAHGEVE